jgi:hypothetical protein
MAMKRETACTYPQLRAGRGPPAEHMGPTFAQTLAIKPYLLGHRIARSLVQVQQCHLQHPAHIS